MEQRPIPEQDVERIVQLLMENSHFVASWDEIDDPSVMRVFGKKKAERESIARHFDYVSRSCVQYFVAKSVDEKRMLGSTMWRLGDVWITRFLNNKVREPDELLIYDKGLVRITVNSSGLSRINWSFKNCSMHTSVRCLLCCSGARSSYQTSN